MQRQVLEQYPLAYDQLARNSHTRSAFLPPIYEVKVAVVKMKMLVVLMVALVAVRGRPAEDIGEPDEASVRAAMLKATRGLNQTQADVVLSTLENAHVSNTSTSDPTYQAQQRSHRESQDNGHSDRSKEIRINEIKNRVLGYLERFGRRNSTGIGPQQPSRPLFHDAYSASTPEVFAEKLQSFYPSCELPRNTDEDVWSDGKSLNLLFDVSYPTPAEGSVATIITAKLRLYKLAQANISQLRENCPTPETEEKSETDNTIVDEQADQAGADEEIVTSTEDQPSPDDQGLLSDQSQQPEETLIVEEDTQVRVSVYWYTRSVKKHRVKRKLLDSKMFSVYGDEWAEFNIRPAVRAWRDVRKNFGLVVEVEDEDGQLLDASKYFTTMNCTNEASATVRPIPGFLVETARVLLLQNGANFNAEDGPDAASTMALNPIYLDAFLFPMIDICTVELAQPKAMYERSHYSLGGQQPTNTAEPEPVSQQDQDEEFVEEIPYAVSYTSHNFDHPHRHSHHHEVQNDSEQENSDWTHDFRRHIINKTVIMQAAQIKQALSSQRENSRLL